MGDLTKQDYKPSELEHYLDEYRMINGYLSDACSELDRILNKFEARPSESNMAKKDNPLSCGLSGDFKINIEAMNGVCNIIVAQVRRLSEYI